MSADENDDRQAKTVAELETDEAGIVKRWIAELNLSDESEKDWREEAKEIQQIYEAGKEQQKASSFPILWANTETLQPAVYNSRPEPDVRRRWREADPLGKAASTVLQRAISYQCDVDEFDEAIEDGVLDALLTGRGLCRIKYVPTTVPQEDESGAPVMDAEGNVQEELVDESVPIEHVQWNDFRRGPGKRWADVPWIAFRHDMTLDTLVEFFGKEKAGHVPLEESEALKKDQRSDAETKKVFRTAEVWEIWDKEKRRVLFICKRYKTAPLQITDDPLGLPGFWPVPRPVNAINCSTSLSPIPPYRQYKMQAEELEKVTQRINKTVDALRLRGAYTKVAKEAEAILTAGDGDMIAIESVAEIAQMGGLDKAIWIMPVEKLIVVLRGLYESRDQLKATIYEISGVSDIIRGSTDPDETATAQSLKSKWGSLRLDKLKRDVQRFVRDLMRLQADVICSKFQPETLAEITQVELPTGQEKQQAQMQAQAIQRIPDPAQQQMAMQQLGPQLEPALSQPSWDEVMAVLRNDVQRSYKIDIETDSTVAETIERDLQGIRETVQAIGELIGGALPAVQSGVLPIEAVKDIALAMARHARLGTAVEDALEQIQAPPPAAPPQPEGPDPAIQGIVKELMDAIKAPKKLVAQAGPDGRVEGQIEEAA